MRLVATDLGCIRGERTLFSGLSFSLAPGELLAITGKNGAGKSSLLRQIVGLVPVAQGQVRLEGADPEARLAEQAHYIGHLDAMKPALTARENLQFWQSFHGAPWRSIDEALDRLGLLSIADLPTAYLSQGQRRRLALARLLANRRPVWLLDEPMTALEFAAQTTVAGLMRHHQAQGGLILAATHGALGLASTAHVDIGA